MSGKKAKAPCGHDGEYIIGNYVRCLHGCDSANKSAKPSCPKCQSTDLYAGKYHEFKYIACHKCGHILKNVGDFAKPTPSKFVWQTSDYLFPEEEEDTDPGGWQPMPPMGIDLPF